MEGSPRSRKRRTVRISDNDPEEIEVRVTGNKVLVSDVITAANAADAADAAGCHGDTIDSADCKAVIKSALKKPKDRATKVIDEEEEAWEEEEVPVEGEEAVMWSPRAVIPSDKPIVNKKPKRSSFPSNNSFEKSPTRLRESSSESNISPSRIKEAEIRRQKAAKKAEQKERLTSPRTSEVESPVSISAEQPAATEERVILKIPARKTDSGNESNDTGSQREVEKGAATSPVRQHVRGIETNGDARYKSSKQPLNIERLIDRPLTDEEIKEKLEQLIVSGHYPFARVQQRSHASPDTTNYNNSNNNTTRWIPQSNASSAMPFVDSSPLKEAALQLEIKLRKYQKQIGSTPSKKSPKSAGLSGYTALLLQSVSVMIGYLTEQADTNGEERSMRDDVITTMTALQNTVETLSDELLSCRKELSDTKHKITSMEHDFSSTLSYLIENCVMKDPSLKSPMIPTKVIRDLPQVISPFTQTPKQDANQTDLMKFTPTDTNLIQLTPKENAESVNSDQKNSNTDSKNADVVPEAKIETPSVNQSSKDYLKFLEAKADSVRKDIDAKFKEISPRSPDVQKSLLQSKSTPSVNISTITDASLDISQDLDALIVRLKHMNEQTLALSSEQKLPQKSEKSSRIKDALDLDAPNRKSDRIKDIIDSYNRPSNFSPTQLRPQPQAKSSSPSEVSVLEIPDAYNQIRKLSGEYIQVEEPSLDIPAKKLIRPITPNPLSPKRLHEEIKKSILEDSEGSQPNTSLSIHNTSTEISSPDKSHLAMRSPDLSSPRKSALSRSSSNLLNASAFSPPTKMVGSDDEEAISPEPSSIITKFLLQNPTYLKEMEEQALKDAEHQKASVRRSKSTPARKAPRIRGSVNRNIQKFEQKSQEIAREVELNTSPKREATSRSRRRDRVETSPRQSRAVRREKITNGENKRIDVRDKGEQERALQKLEENLGGGDLMTQLLTLNDAKLTQLVSSLTKLTEKRGSEH